MTGGPKIQLETAALSRLVARALGAFLLLAMAGMGLRAADLPDAQRLLRTGHYHEAIEAAQTAIREGATSGSEEWHLVLVQSLLAVGRYPEADTAATIAMNREAQSLRLRWLAREVALSNGLTEKAAALLHEIRQLVTARAWFYRDPQNLVTFGRAALHFGADPKDVLDRLYANAQRSEPTLRDVYLARGELALEKHDYALAATAFQEGLKHHPEDADMNYGLARAFENGDRATMLAALETALKTNPRHIPSLLLLVEHRIDAEDYDGAAKLLDEIRTVNPAHPEHWAARAIIAHLRNQPVAEKLARTSALRYWSTNPRVDYLIGRKLSQKYRFAEGAAYQRQALRFDRNYLPAKAQLASDLLRLGDEDGWRVAREVHEQDGYDVEAYNLVTLYDTMTKYETLANEDFVVRMTSHEAKVYGPRVLDLLTRAKHELVDKYGAELAKPTFVEIFADPKDFAVRTFGLPDVPGFLGVCFGRVVTANSPAANAGQAVNWESVLWHEFCHVVTLQMTRNRMPRWLSEGISVYEERQANEAWGMQMTPQYREMILGGEMTPVSKLSAAFLAPKSGQHLQFAYFQSSLVVEFMIERFGLEPLKALLQALREGHDINAAIAEQTAPLETIEREFERYARAKAEQIATNFDWEKPEPLLLLPGAEDRLAEWAAKRPDNYWALTTQARRLIAQNRWAEAQPILQRLIERYPRHAGADSSYRLLATTHRALGETESERAALTRLAEIDGEATDIYLRLMELEQAEKDWPAVARNAQRFLGVNPLVASPYRYLAEASAEIGDAPTAIVAYRTLLELDPPNPAETHFHLAEQLHRVGEPQAKRHVLQALEEAPRYRAALELLLNMNRPSAREEPAEAVQSPEANL